MTGKKWLTLIVVVLAAAVSIGACAAFQQMAAPQRDANQPQDVIALSTSSAMVPQVAEAEADFGVSNGIAAAPAQQSQSIPPTPQDMFFEDYGINRFIDASEDPLSTF